MRARSWWARHWSAWGWIALTVVGALVVQLGIADGAQALPLLSRPAVAAPKADLGTPVKVTPVPVRHLPQPKPPANYQAPAPKWPGASTTSVPVAKAASGTSSSSAKSPVWGQVLPGTHGADTGPSSLA
ncbi:hypothetical protein GXW82_10325 [Streptacidiphilus sp. 4-A2]|nr:hypothetical protein [Streptacidiphilus sp. 4-A2]